MIGSFISQFKILIISYGLLFSVASCNSQKKYVTLYGYSRTLTQGTMPHKDIHEDGTVTTIERKAKKNYIIYAEIKTNKEISFTDIWLDGIHFTAKTELIENHSDRKGKNQNDTLAPVTPHKILLITPVDNTEKMGLPTPPLPEKYKMDELVLGYIISNKNKYAAIKKLTKLTADITQ